MITLLLRVPRQQSIEEPKSTERDAPEKYPKNNNNKQIRKPTQYLTRFDNLPTSLGQGREILLIQHSIQVFQRDTIHGALPVYL